MKQRNFAIGARLMGTTAGALVLMIAFVAIGIVNVSKVSDEAHVIVGENSRQIALADDMQSRNLLIGRHLRTALLRHQMGEVLEERRKIDADLGKYLEDEAQVQKLAADDTARAILAAAVAARQGALDVLERTFALKLAGKHAQAEALFFEQGRPQLQKWLDPLGEYASLQHVRQQQALESIDRTRDATRLWMLGLIALAVAIMVPAGLFVTRGITRPLREACAVADGIAGGRLDNRVDADGRDELTALALSLRTMQQNLLERITAERRIADENARIRNALDYSTANIRICDDDGTIIYVNRTLQRTLKRIEEGIRRRIPDFTAETMVGRNIGIFYENPAAAVDALRQLSGERRMRMDIGGRNYLVVTNPVMTAAGQRLGTVAEWVDQTDELHAQEEIAAIVAAARHGDLSRRIDPAGKAGFFEILAGGMNHLLDVTQQALQATSRALSAIAAGDLTETVRGEYEGIFGQLRDDINTTVERLRLVVGRIQEATGAINGAAQEIAAGNSDLSRRTEEQASSLEETAASMEELNATVKQNAENAHQATRLAKSANETATRGGEVVMRVVATMDEIQASSKRIADIVGVIDSIAFQTNILALNAAVEAARAGEQGRGFAVVATEVRSLAQRSAQAAKEIKALIAESVDRVEHGAGLVHQAGEAADDVMTSFQLVANLVTEISEASAEQSAGIGQVTQAISQMDEVTQHNAALVEEAAAAAESLEGQARSLAQAVGSFHLPAGAARAASPARSATRPALAGKRASLAAPADDEWDEF